VLQRAPRRLERRLASTCLSRSCSPLKVMLIAALSASMRAATIFPAPLPEVARALVV
jgi:hypothetical protein